VLVPKGLHADYCCVELKGEGCGAYGSDRLSAWLWALDQSGFRWHAVRVDPAWDGVLIDPVVFNAAILAGNFRSRAFGDDARRWWDSNAGQTAYFGGPQRLIRLYNLRGYNRLELQLRGAWAKLLGAELAENRPDLWESRARVQLRSVVEFVDVAAATRVERCPLLPWWASFVGDGSKAKLGRILPKLQSTALGKAELAMQRFARQAWAIRQAYGDDYLLDRLAFWACGKVTTADKLYVQQLSAFAGTGWAGLPLPGQADDCPF
jgi:hypothetical protein